MKYVYFDLDTETAYCSLQCTENSTVPSDAKLLWLTPQEIAERMPGVDVHCSQCQSPIILVPEVVS
jgi:hypothetical protein